MDPIDNCDFRSETGVGNAHRLYDAVLPHAKTFIDAYIRRTDKANQNQICGQLVEHLRAQQINPDYANLCSRVGAHNTFCGTIFRQAIRNYVIPPETPKNQLKKYKFKLKELAHIFNQAKQTNPFTGIDLSNESDEEDSINSTNVELFDTIEPFCASYEFNPPLLNKMSNSNKSIYENMLRVNKQTDATDFISAKNRSYNQHNQHTQRLYQIFNALSDIADSLHDINETGKKPYWTPVGIHIQAQIGMLVGYDDWKPYLLGLNDVLCNSTTNISQVRLRAIRDELGKNMLKILALDGYTPDEPIFLNEDEVYYHYFFYLLEYFENGVLPHFLFTESGRSYNIYSFLRFANSSIDAGGQDAFIRSLIDYYCSVKGVCQDQSLNSRFSSLLAYLYSASDKHNAGLSCITPMAYFDAAGKRDGANCPPLIYCENDLSCFGYNVKIISVKTDTVERHITIVCDETGIIGITKANGAWSIDNVKNVINNRARDTFTSSRNSDGEITDSANKSDGWIFLMNGIEQLLNGTIYFDSFRLYSVQIKAFLGGIENLGFCVMRQDHDNHEMYTICNLINKLGGDKYIQTVTSNAQLFPQYIPKAFGTCDACLASGFSLSMCNPQTTSSYDMLLQSGGGAFLYKKMPDGNRRDIRLEKLFDLARLLKVGLPVGSIIPDGDKALFQQMLGNMSPEKRVYRGLNLILNDDYLRKLLRIQSGTFTDPYDAFFYKLLIREIEMKRSQLQSFSFDAFTSVYKVLDLKTPLLYNSHVSSGLVDDIARFNNQTMFKRQPVSIEIKEDLSNFEIDFSVHLANNSFTNIGQEYLYGDYDDISGPIGDRATQNGLKKYTIKFIKTLGTLYKLRGNMTGDRSNTDISDLARIEEDKICELVGVDPSVFRGGFIKKRNYKKYTRINKKRNKRRRTKKRSMNKGRR